MCHFLKVIFHVLTLEAPTPQNGQTLKQFVGKLPTNCLSVFDYFVGLALEFISIFHEINFYYFSVLWKKIYSPHNEKIFFTSAFDWEIIVISILRDPDKISYLTWITEANLSQLISTPPIIIRKPILMISGEI